jgi:arylsulfatase A-like enzyme
MKKILFRNIWIGILFTTSGIAVGVADSRPNIVFLMSDDQNLYSMGSYGTPDVQTPNLDRLANEGIVFDHHYDTTAICMASRANVMTGKYEYKNGTNFEHGNMMQSTWEGTYPMLLREAGYSTAFAGKFGFDVSMAPEEKGRLPEDDFDRWGGGPGQTSYETKKNKSMAKYADEYPHSTLSYGAFSRDFITDAAKGDQPFCLSISFKAAHRPTTPDPKFDHVYKGKTFTKPGNYGREFSEHFSEQSKQGRQYVRFEEWNYSDKYDEVMAIYYQQIYGIDVAVGMIRDALDKAGVADNTIVIYTSDNGFFCGAHGYGSKVLPYEEASRVPLIMYDPRHKNSGRQLRSAALTGNIDFAPTMLELAGVPIPSEMDGRSLVPLYDDPRSEIHESLTLINAWGPISAQSLSVVTKDWKYIYWPYGGDGMKPTEEMFHLAEDRMELVNRAVKNQHPEVLKELRGEYDKVVRSWRDGAVDYNNYEPYGDYYDRTIPWSKKSDRLPKMPKSRK